MIRSRNQRSKPAPDIRSLATKKIENVVLKSLQIVRSQSYRQVTSGGEVIAYPSPTYDAMYAAVLTNATARPMIIKKRDEAFRNGIHVEPNFTSKCYMCDAEYDHIVEFCDKPNCGGPTRTVNLSEEKILTDLLEIRNSNSQNLTDVLKEISIDHDIVDDGWLVSRNIYQELNGEIIDFETVEFWRIHPGNAAFSMADTGRIGEYEFTCIYHREIAEHDEFAICRECGRVLHKVVAVRFRDQTIEMRYIKEEIFHGSEYNPSAIYGFPPAITMWYNLLLLAAQEKFMADYYVEKKWPTAAIFVPAKKRESAEFFKEKLDEHTNKDQQARPVFRFDPDAKHKPEVVRLTDTPEEMNFVPVREEGRMRLAGFYGISPIFNADVQGSGGLNNESRQITVMSWATENKQKAIQENYLDKIVKNAKVIDWHFEFAQIEEEDEAADVQLDLLRAQYAQLMMGLNFKVELDDDGKPTKFTEGEAQVDPFSQMMQPEMEPNPMDSNLGGMESITQQKSAKSKKNIDLKTASDAIWDTSRRNISKYVDKETANIISGKISKELMEDYALEGIDALYNENLKKVFLDENKSAEPYLFNYEYSDWEWKKDYEFIKFENIIIDQLNIHPDFEIKEEDVENESPRVRKGTLDYYMTEVEEMSPLIVDLNYNLLDGHHRLYVLKAKNQKTIRVAIVKPKDNGDVSTKSFLENIHPRDKLGRFTKKVSSALIKPINKMGKKKLESILPPEFFYLDWIENTIAGNPELNITTENIDDTIEEYGTVSFAILELRKQIKKEKSKVSKLYIAYKMKEYIILREQMIPQLQTVVGDLISYDMKSNQIKVDDYNKRIAEIDEIYGEGITLDEIQQIIDDLESEGISLKTGEHYTVDPKQVRGRPRKQPNTSINQLKRTKPYNLEGKKIRKVSDDYFIVFDSQEKENKIIIKTKKTSQLSKKITIIEFDIDSKHKSHIFEFKKQLKFEGKLSKSSNIPISETNILKVLRIAFEQEENEKLVDWGLKSGENTQKSVIDINLKSEIDLAEYKWEKYYEKLIKLKAEFKEEEHPRTSDGRFGTKESDRKKKIKEEIDKVSKKLKKHERDALMPLYEKQAKYLLRTIKTALEEDDFDIDDFIEKIPKYKAEAKCHEIAINDNTDAFELETHQNPKGVEKEYTEHPKAKKVSKNNRVKIIWGMIEQELVDNPELNDYKPYKDLGDKGGYSATCPICGEVVYREDADGVPEINSPCEHFVGSYHRSGENEPEDAIMNVIRFLEQSANVDLDTHSVDPNNDNSFNFYDWEENFNEIIQGIDKALNSNYDYYTDPKNNYYDSTADDLIDHLENMVKHGVIGDEYGRKINNLINKYKEAMEIYEETDKWIFEPKVSTKADFKEENVKRDASGKFAKKKEIKLVSIPLDLDKIDFDRLKNDPEYVKSLPFNQINDICMRAFEEGIYSDNMRFEGVYNFNKEGKTHLDESQFIHMSNEEKITELKATMPDLIENMDEDIESMIEMNIGTRKERETKLEQDWMDIYEDDNKIKLEKEFIENLDFNDPIFNDIKLDTIDGLSEWYLIDWYVKNDDFVRFDDSGMNRAEWIENIKSKFIASEDFEKDVIQNLLYGSDESPKNKILEEKNMPEIPLLYKTDPVMKEKYEKRFNKQMNHFEDRINAEKTKQTKEYLNNKMKRYYNRMYYDGEGKSLSNAIYTTPLSIDDDQVFYHGTSLEIMEKALINDQLGGTTFYITDDINTAKGYGNLVVKMKRETLNEVYPDPDVFNPHGWDTEQDSSQFIDGNINPNKIESILFNEYTSIVGEMRIKLVGKNIDLDDYKKKTIGGYGNVRNHFEIPFDVFKEIMQ